MLHVDTLQPGTEADLRRAKHFFHAWRHTGTQGFLHLAWRVAGFRFWHLGCLEIGILRRRRDMLR